MLRTREWPLLEKLRSSFAEFSAGVRLTPFSPSRDSPRSDADVVREGLEELSLKLAICLWHAPISRDTITLICEVRYVSVIIELHDLACGRIS